MKNLFIYLILLVSVAIYSSCNPMAGNPVLELFPNPPDTSHLPKFMSGIDAEEIAAVISLRITMRNGDNRKLGNPKDPRNGGDFRSFHFDNVNWRGIQIQDADFRGSYFRSANCDISDFSYSDFRVGNLESAKFNKATLIFCRFDQASLFFLKADNALFDNSSFKGANLLGMYGNGSSFKYCDFSKAVMQDALFAEANFSGSKAIKANFNRAVLVEARFDSADLSYSTFIKASLQRSSFVNARIHNADFHEANLLDADFSGADLKGCEFLGAGFYNTNFHEAINIPEVLKAKLVDDKYTGVLYSE